MNLHACLGVGPGHRLLLGTLSPAVGYVVAAMAVVSAPVRMETRVLRPATSQRPKRGTLETRAMYERIRAYIAKGLKAERDPFELREEVCKAEGIERSYCDYIVSKLGLARSRRSAEEIKALVAKARALMGANPNWTKRRVAAELLVDECYLHVILSRHGG